MDRRDFLQYSSLAGGLIALPRGYRHWNGSLTPIPTADKKALADTALNAARARGASYADVRIGRYLNQSASPMAWGSGCWPTTPGGSRPPTT